MAGLKTRSLAAPGWASPISVRDRVSGGTCIAPNASLQGSGLPFAGYAGMTAAPQHGTTVVAARKDDARVPEPRGRKR